MVYVVSAVRRTLRRWAIRALRKAHLAAYRVSRVRVLGSVAGMPVLLLTTTGRRSGKARTTPLTFFRDATDLVVIAANGRADRSPDWSLNLQQTPRAVVEIGTDTLVVTARPASNERERLWVVITATYAGYARYQDRTERRIQVVLLHPKARKTQAGPQRSRDPAARQPLGHGRQSSTRVIAGAQSGSLVPPSPPSCFVTTLRRSPLASTRQISWDPDGASQVKAICLPSEDHVARPHPPGFRRAWPRAFVGPHLPEVERQRVRCSLFRVNRTACRPETMLACSREARPREHAHLASVRIDDVEVGVKGAGCRGRPR